MRWKLISGLAVVVTATVLIAAAVGGRGTHDVGGQRFAVPKDWLFEATIPWLPAAETDSFTFHLDPIRNPNEIPPHLVLVQAAERICGSNRMSQMMEAACGPQQTQVPFGPPYRKVFPRPDYPDEWIYNAVSDDGSAGGQARALEVARCTPIEPNPGRPKGTAICTSAWGVDGLVLSLGFEENELAYLPEMRNRATQMLLSWKVR